VSGQWLAVGAAAVLAAASVVGRRRGSRTVDAYVSLGERVHGRTHDWRGLPLALHTYYPATAAGQVEIYRDEDVFWSGPARRRYGVAGPTDGTMVPIEARYVYPVAGNIFDFDKLAALVNAIEAGDEPIVRSGYAAVGLVDRTHIEESRAYAADIQRESYAQPYTDDDLGELTAQVRDGNHRAFAGLIAGSDVAWLRISDNDKQDLLIPSAVMKQRRGAHLQRHFDRLYAAIRRAQRAHGAPLLTRPRLKPIRRSAALDQAEARLAYIRSEMPRLQWLLYQRYDDGADAGGPDTLEDRKRWPGRFMRRLFGRILRADTDRFLRIRQQDTEMVRLRELDAERTALVSKLYDLREAAGLNPRTGERATR
jgi:hypothetical protein